MGAFTPKPGFRFDPFPPREALEYFRAKGWKIGFDYRDVWREEHALAFTVAKAMSMDVLTTIREEVDRALAEGRTLRQFQKDLQPRLEALGWWGRGEEIDQTTGEKRPAQLGSPRRLRTIYNANLRTARAAGQWERIERMRATHPFLLYRLGPSQEHRLQHVKWDGLLLPADDPWWNTHMPPNGWGCKCWVRQVSRAEAERLKQSGVPDPLAPPIRDEEGRLTGRRERVMKPVQTAAPPTRYRRWKNKRTGKTERVPEGIDPGWDTNPGVARAEHLARLLGDKARGLPPEAQGPIPVLAEDVVTAKRLEARRGTHPGGLYEGSDGVRRYVKRYEDPAQAYGEAVANRLYQALGLDAPDPALFASGGRLAFASGWVSGEPLGRAGLTKERARRILEGFAADVWLANWDALGLELDNVLVSGARAFRVDNGGALLFRARAGRKPAERLSRLDDWDGFADPGRNPAYAKVFKAAGLGSADELGKKALTQIRAIQELGLRTRDFEDLLPPVPGVPEQDRLAILQSLRNRARLLEEEILPRVRAFLEAPPRERKFRKLLGQRYAGLLRGALEGVRASGGERHGLRDAELAANHGYTGDDFVELNDTLRGLRGPAALRRLKPYIDTIIAGLNKLADVAGVFNRGTTLPPDVLAKHQPGTIVTYAEFTSASTGPGFGGPHRFKIEGKHGKDVRFLSAHPGEEEILFKPGTRFKVMKRTKRGGRIHFEMVEVE
jgi:hypothetical protein